jgi:hypothetical protein
VSARRTARRGSLAVLCVFGALGAGARAAGAQANVPPHAAQPAAWPERLSGATRATLDAVADSARRAGLPTAPLYAKAAEGVLKGADEARIVSAVRVLRRELAVVRTALGPTATVSELVAGASAVHAGVPATTLQVLAETRARASDAALRSRSLAVPLVVAADLALRGVPPEVAGASVTALIARGAPDAQFSLLWRGVEQDILAGRTPGSAAVARTRAIVETLDMRGIDDVRRRPPLDQSPSVDDADHVVTPGA